MPVTAPSVNTEIGLCIILFVRVYHPVAWRVQRAASSETAMTLHSEDLWAATTPKVKYLLLVLYTTSVWTT